MFDGVEKLSVPVQDAKLELPSTINKGLHPDVSLCNFGRLANS